MSKKSNKKTYERLIRGILNEISVTPKEDEAKFLRLKKKANKYLRRFEESKK